MKNPPHKPPSRIRYEKNHPTISFRVTLDERRRIDALIKKTGQSMRSIVLQNLGLVETNIKSAYQKGYKVGWGRFTAPCSICGKPMQFDIKTAADAKDTLTKAFTDWRHPECEAQ